MDDRLVSFLKFLDEIPQINSGGCGIAALSVGRFCDKIGYPTGGFAFLYHDGDDWDMEHNERSLEQGRLDRLEVPPHVAIIVDGCLVDSKGKNADRCYPLVQEGIEEPELVYLLNRDGWNDCFERIWIQAIQVFGGIGLSDVLVDIL